MDEDRVKLIADHIRQLVREDGPHIAIDRVALAVADIVREVERTTLARIRAALPDEKKVEELRRRDAEATRNWRVEHGAPFYQGTWGVIGTDADGDRVVLVGNTNFDSAADTGFAVAARNLTPDLLALDAAVRGAK